jgi:hypothetical protein
MPNVCPCCHRKMPTPRAVSDKRLAQDIERAQSAIDILSRAWSNLEYSPALRSAIHDEQVRLETAKFDHALLWRIYRRRDKGLPYFQTAPIPVSSEPIGELVAA